MDWDRLRIFHTVAKAGSLTAAGYELNVSQSAVSRQISSLEKELSVQLFSRHARGLVLTEQGEILVRTTNSMFAQIAKANAQMSDFHGETSGTLRVATSVALGSVWLAPRLRKFNKLFPEMKFQIILTDKEVDFSMREADLAISFQSASPGSNVLEEKLFRFYLGIYASKDYIAKKGTPKTFDDLDDHQLIVFGSHARPPVENVNWILRAHTKPGYIRSSFMAINNAFGIVQAVKHGLGIASLSNFIANDDKELVELFEDSKKPTIDAYFTHPPHLKDSKRVKVFKEFIKREIEASLKK